MVLSIRNLLKRTGEDMQVENIKIQTPEIRLVDEQCLLVFKTDMEEAINQHEERVFNKIFEVLDDRERRISTNVCMVAVVSQVVTMLLVTWII
jgi:hypothetical protein